MAIDSKNVKETLSKHILADGFNPVMDMDKSHGSWLVDERDGTEYLDMFSMFASGAVGYNHPDIIAKRDRLAISAHNKPTLSDIYNVYFAEFVDTFSKTAIPDYLPHTFFIEGGGLAVENALKVAFDWKVRKNISNGKGEKGSRIIHFNQAFHGRTGYTLSLTNTTDPRKTMYFPKFDWPRIINPTLTFPITDEVLEEVKQNEKLAVIDDVIAALPEKQRLLIKANRIHGETYHQISKRTGYSVSNICRTLELVNKALQEAVDNWENGHPPHTFEKKRRNDRN